MDQDFNILLEMVLDLFETTRMHEIVGIYETQNIDSVLNDKGGPVAIGGGAGLFGSVLEHDGKRTGWQNRQDCRFRDSDRDDVGLPCLSFEAFEAGRQEGEMPGYDGDTDADAHDRVRGRRL